MDEFDIDIGESDNGNVRESEYAHIKKWCNKFINISVGVHGNRSRKLVSERMKIFNFLIDMASNKDELMDPFDYFNMKVTCPSCEGDGCRRCKYKGKLIKKPNKFSRTLNEKQIREYVSYLHQKVKDLENTKVVPNYIGRKNGD